MFKKIGLFVLGIILSLTIAIISLNVFLVNTLANNSFYDNVYNKAGTSITQIVIDYAPDSIPIQVRQKFGEDIDVLFRNIVFYSIGYKPNLSYTLDKQAYLNLLKQENLTGEEVESLLDNINTKIQSYILQVKEKLSSANKNMAYIWILFWPSIIILILVLVGAYFLANGLRDYLLWLGNRLAWPTLFGLIILIILRGFVNIGELLKEYNIQLDNNALTLIRVFVESLLNWLILISAIIFTIGLIIWIVHFFIPKKS